MTSISPQVLAQLAPNGVLCASVYLGNFLLVTGQSSDGELTGIAPDMCRAVAERLGVPLQLLGYKTQDEVVESAATEKCGIALVGSDPARAKLVTFTSAYVELEATYLVPAGSSITKLSQVDQPGVRIASFRNSAYDLWLQRNLRNASLIHADSLAASNALFDLEKLDALAGLTTGLVTVSQNLPGSRILPGQFTGIQQAISTKKAHLESIAFLNACVAEWITSGFVSNLIQKHDVRGVSVASINQ
ncbi:transporter substrate-binding domain-containing protein [Polynucleobacter brandtiae]|uniref:Polar amino acid transport system substrate-binding protein n=1 Tax=Polynucleobacter brandtiae TaxID=1938816 RepID=A0A2M8VZM4_9BURK|nr:transporter substrate-binding domain-containing protein [Polynucleobacter brandtiae]PJI83309.1 polar amino acid transport system substrate-binding protein [Polynucleobacter brandtiae]